MDDQFPNQTPAAGSRAFTVRQIAEVAIILCAVFGADIALARVVDVVLDAIHLDAGK